MASTAQHDEEVRLGAAFPGQWLAASGGQDGEDAEGEEGDEEEEEGEDDEGGCRFE